METTLALVNQAAKSRHITLELDCNYSGNLDGDRSQLQQAIINLLLNAIQASEENNSITINAHVVAEQLIIKIHDQGCGIEQASLDKIYDPFFSTKAEGEGTGLGLSISLGIIEHHHGTLDIRNNDTQGVTATIILPVTKSSIK